MAPLSATLAAGVAVGVGIVLARATRERRAAPAPDPDRRLGLLPNERPAQGLQRMALGQADISIELLERARGRSANEHAVHETRKALKRLRALLRLLDGQLARDTLARENAALADIARRLSGARDARVTLSTLDALIERHPHKLARRKRVRKLRRTLVAEHRRMERRTLGHSATRAQALTDLRAFRARVAAWELPDRDGTKPAHAGLLRIYGQGRARQQRAARRGGKDTQAMHRWRKRIKDLRYAAEMLEPISITKRKRQGQAARLHRLASRADALAETLGEDHDLAVLAQRVRASRKSTTHKVLLKAIARRRRELRKRALRDGALLYRRQPQKLARKLS